MVHQSCDLAKGLQPESVKNAPAFHCAENLLRGDWAGNIFLWVFDYADRIARLDKSIIYFEFLRNDGAIIGVVFGNQGQIRRAEYSDYLYPMA